jgi:hypothetical protein
MNFFSKLLTVPSSNSTKQIDVVQMWEVRWCAMKHNLDFDGHSELECFPTEVGAEEFATALRNAFKLIRMRTMDKVTVTKGPAV